jgi:hypothetical protein
VGNTLWQPSEVIVFATDCIKHGIKAVSLGGGEPFEYEGIFEVIEALYPLCYLSITSNGLPLEKSDVWQKLKQCKPDKIHITIHQPDNDKEVERVEALLPRIEAIGIKPGLNLLVGANKIEAATNVFQQMMKILNNDQIILVQQRFSNTPTPKQLASVAKGKPFQSPSCLLGCKRPENFCSVSWDKKVNSCSFANGKVPLKTLDYEGLQLALSEIVWENDCLHS